MYNKDIYDKLYDKYGAFDMPLICEALSEYFGIMYEDSDNKVEKRDFDFEKVWWKTAKEQAIDLVNKQ